MITYETALENIKSLSRSQGFYGRLYVGLQHDKDLQEYVKEICKQSSDVVDFIMKLEG